MRASLLFFLLFICVISIASAWTIAVQMVSLYARLRYQSQKAHRLFVAFKEVRETCGVVFLKAFQMYIFNSIR